MCGYRRKQPAASPREWAPPIPSPPQSEDGAVPGFGLVAGEVIHDVFDHGVLVQGVGRHVLAEAGLLHATVGHFADDRDVVPWSSSYSSFVTIILRSSIDD